MPKRIAATSPVTQEHVSGPASIYPYGVVTGIHLQPLQMILTVDYALQAADGTMTDRGSRAYKYAELPAAIQTAFEALEEKALNALIGSGLPAGSVEDIPA